jgi:thioredoxin 1
MPVLDFSSDVFKAQMTKKEPLIIVCSASWCGPCGVLVPLLEELSNRSDFAHLTFLKLDVDEDDTLAQAMNVATLPTVIFFRGGKECSRIVSGDFDAVQKMTKKFVSSK